VDLWSATGAKKGNSQQFSNWLGFAGQMVAGLFGKVGHLLC